MPQLYIQLRKETRYFWIYKIKIQTNFATFALPHQGYLVQAETMAQWLTTVGAM